MNDEPHFAEVESLREALIPHLNATSFTQKLSFVLMLRAYRMASGQDPYDLATLKKIVPKATAKLNKVLAEHIITYKPAAQVPGNVVGNTAAGVPPPGPAGTAGPAKLTGNYNPATANAQELTLVSSNKGMLQNLAVTHSDKADRRPTTQPAAELWLDVAKGFGVGSALPPGQLRSLIEALLHHMALEMNALFRHVCKNMELVMRGSAEEKLPPATTEAQMRCLFLLMFVIRGTAKQTALYLELNHNNFEKVPWAKVTALVASHLAQKLNLPNTNMDRLHDEEDGDGAIAQLAKNTTGKLNTAEEMETICAHQLWSEREGELYLAFLKATLVVKVESGKRNARPDDNDDANVQAPQKESKKKKNNKKQPQQKAGCPACTQSGIVGRVKWAASHSAADCKFKESDRRIAATAAAGAAAGAAPTVSSS